MTGAPSLPAVGSTRTCSSLLGATRSPFVRNAQAVCAACPVAEQCLEFALEVGETEGIWGELSGRQLRQEKRRRAGGVRRKAPTTIDHGTEAGYHAHRRAGTPTCQSCREAHAAYEAERERERAA